VADDLVGPAVARLVNLRPGLRVRVSVVAPESIQEEVLLGRHELGLCGIESQTPHDELCIVPLRERRLFLTCRAEHPLAGSTPTLQQVLSYPLVTVFMHGPKARGAFLGNGGAGAEDRLRKGFTPAIEVNSIDTAKQVARNSNALFPASMQMVASELARGELVCLDYDAPELRTRSALVRLRDRTPSPVALKFMELIRKREAELLALEETPAPVAA